jgi:hypothetical protein
MGLRRSLGAAQRVMFASREGEASRGRGDVVMNDAAVGAARPGHWG